MNAGSTIRFYFTGLSRVLQEKHPNFSEKALMCFIKKLTAGIGNTYLTRITFIDKL